MPFQLSLAPIRGITNALFRNLYSLHFSGLDSAIAPFITTLSARRINLSHIKDILPENNHGMPVIPQILGKDPSAFIQLATLFYDLGYPTVNWNLGCPYAMVAKKRRGSGMLPHPEMIEEFLDSVMARIPCRLSIKARIGRESKEEIFSLLPIFNNYPIEEIILHPRTGIQMYDGKADLDIFERCLPIAKLPLTYNGDIFDLKTFLMLRKRFRTVTKWLIGRGILYNPFLPEILRSGKEEIPFPIERFRHFHQALFDAYRSELSGPSHLIDKMKGHWLYFSRSFENGADVFKKIKKVNTIRQYEDLVTHFLNKKITGDRESKR